MRMLCQTIYSTPHLTRFTFSAVRFCASSNLGLIKIAYRTALYSVWICMYSYLYMSAHIISHVYNVSFLAVVFRMLCIRAQCTYIYIYRVRSLCRGLTMHVEYVVPTFSSTMHITLSAHTHDCTFVAMMFCGWMMMLMCVCVYARVWVGYSIKRSELLCSCSFKCG